MNLKEIKLIQNDIKLLHFLARFKLMRANDAIFFYGSSYYQKRLQELKNANYISRYYRTYIKLTPACIRYLETFNIKCQVPCRNKEYIDRLVYISKIGIELEKAKIKYKLSWEIKGNNYTNWSRRFLGEIILKNERYIMYYAKSDKKYIRQLHFDINKDLSYQNVIVFIDNFDVIDSKNPFIFQNKVSCLLVNIKEISNMLETTNNVKEKLEHIYGKKIENSNINLADYKVDNADIIYMPIIDTHKIEALNSYFSLGMIDNHIDIISFRKNFKILSKLLSKEAKEKCTYVEIREKVNEL